MKRKNIADTPAVVSEGGAPAGAAPKKARTPRATATIHKHKKAMTAAPESATAEALEADAIAGPTHEHIAIRAYLIAERRGFSGGSPIEDWFQAERELREELLGRA